jgi:hypothetical protein
MDSNKIYSVIVSHEGEIHSNYLFTDKASAIAKMEDIRRGWLGMKKINANEPLLVHEYSKKMSDFTAQYSTKLGYWYENGEWEYGSVDLIECTLPL